jgi:hypothetical protein
MHLVEEKNHTAMRVCGRLRSCPDPFPESRQRGLRAVTRCVETHRASLLLEIKEECGFTYLARPGQQLDPGGRSFGEALEEAAAAVLIVHD